MAEAFRAVPRHGFLPRSERGRASYDGPTEIGDGQTNSQPRTVDAMLRLLDVDRGMRVLDVGAGSGWTTALLAHLAGPTGSVFGLEIEPGLVALGGDLAAGPALGVDRGRRHRACSAPGVGAVRPDPGVGRGLRDAGPSSTSSPTRAGGGAGALADDAARPVGRGAEVTHHGSYRFVPLL